MKKYYFIISLFVFNNLYAQQSKGFDWLVGNWKISNNRGFIIETWKKQNDSLYIGSSGFVKGKDTIPEENVELKKVVGDWFYIPTVANQNNNKPVSFKIIFNKGEEFICENPTHDFPQRINYRLVGTTTLFASIEGKTKGKYKKINYDYLREK